MPHDLIVDFVSDRWLSIFTPELCCAAQHGGAASRFKGRRPCLPCHQAFIFVAVVLVTLANLFCRTMAMLCYRVRKWDCALLSFSPTLSTRGTRKFSYEPNNRNYSISQHYRKLVTMGDTRRCALVHLPRERLLMHLRLCENCECRVHWQSWIDICFSTTLKCHFSPIMVESENICFR